MRIASRSIYTCCIHASPCRIHKAYKMGVSAKSKKSCHFLASWPLAADRPRPKSQEPRANVRTLPIAHAFVQRSRSLGKCLGKCVSPAWLTVALVPSLVRFAVSLLPANLQGTRRKKTSAKSERNLDEGIRDSFPRRSLAPWNGLWS